jgi:hypothetical protein
MAFHVVVKSDPAKFAKGQFGCEMTQEGLTLTQGKTVIQIATGAKANYAGANRIDVALPDHRLELTIAKFGIYKNRLAKDLAAFLSEGGEPPIIGNYSLPWYFYAMAALPLGIPLITVGGAIPLAAGFGLAGACLGIAQKEEWPTALRLVVAGSIVALGYAVFITILIYVILSHIH